MNFPYSSISRYAGSQSKPDIVIVIFFIVPEDYKEIVINCGVIDNEAKLWFKLATPGMFWNRYVFFIKVYRFAGLKKDPGEEYEKREK